MRSSSSCAIAICRLCRQPSTAASPRRPSTVSNTAAPSVVRSAKTRPGSFHLSNIATRTQPSRPERATSPPTQIQHTSAPSPLREALWSTRYDQQLSSKNSLMVRYSFNRSTDTGEATPSQTTPSFTAAERQNSLNRFNSLLAGLTTVLSPTRVNNFSFHYDNFYNDIPPIPPRRAHHKSAAQPHQRTHLSRSGRRSKLQSAAGHLSQPLSVPRCLHLDTGQPHAATRRRISALHRTRRDQRLRQRHSHPHRRLSLCRPQRRRPGQRSRHSHRSWHQEQRARNSGSNSHRLQQLRRRSTFRTTGASPEVSLSTLASAGSTTPTSPEPQALTSHARI